MQQAQSTRRPRASRREIRREFDVEPGEREEVKTTKTSEKHAVHHTHPKG